MDVVFILMNFSSWQLEDGPGAPPELAWRRKLNGNADILKEFRVTFMEGLKMVLPPFSIHSRGDLASDRAFKLS